MNLERSFTCYRTLILATLLLTGPLTAQEPEPMEFRDFLRELESTLDELRSLREDAERRQNLMIVVNSYVWQRVQEPIGGYEKEQPFRRGALRALAQFAQTLESLKQREIPKISELEEFPPRLFNNYKSNERDFLEFHRRSQKGGNLREWSTPALRRATLLFSLLLYLDDENNFMAAERGTFIHPWCLSDSRPDY